MLQAEHHYPPQSLASSLLMSLLLMDLVQGTNILVAAENAGRSVGWELHPAQAYVGMEEKTWMQPCEILGVNTEQRVCCMPSMLHMPPASISGWDSHHHRA